MVNIYKTHNSKQVISGIDTKLGAWNHFFIEKRSGEVAITKRKHV